MKKILALVLCAVLTFGAINTYIAGASRLGVALAGEHLLPARLASPARSLTVLAAATALAGTATLVWPIGLDPLLRATSASLAAVMFLGTLAAVRLLPAGRLRATAVLASVLTGLTLVLSGIYLVVPAAVASIVTLLEPLTGTLLATVFLGERLAWGAVLGGLLMLGAVAGLYLRELTRAPELESAVQ